MSLRSLQLIWPKERLPRVAAVRRGAGQGSGLSVARPRRATHQAHEADGPVRAPRAGLPGAVLRLSKSIAQKASHLTKSCLKSEAFSVLALRDAHSVRTWVVWSSKPSSVRVYFRQVVLGRAKWAKLLHTIIARVQL